MTDLPNPSSSEMTHVDADGKANMVDVGDKPVTKRRAVAGARVDMSQPLFEALTNNTLSKGDALTIARIAGIQASKRCDELIPLCHSLPLDTLIMDIWFENKTVYLQAEAITHSKTGVEMEALTAVTVAALTLYDMGKAMDKSIAIQDIHLIHKEGGRSGSFTPSSNPIHLKRMKERDESK